MDKFSIVQIIRNQLIQELEALERIAREAQQSATHDTLKPDGKYDTQAIEAGYLAGAQAKRAEEIRGDLAKLDHLKPEPMSHVGAGALVKTADQGVLFISPISGGQSVETEGKKITVVSVHSPVGKALVGLTQGESVEVQTPQGELEYEIEAVS